MDDTLALLTVRELAQRLGVTVRRVRALAASGRVEGAVKVGRDWLIPIASRVAPGRRGPRPRTTKGATQLVLGERGQGQALKRRRQRRFQDLASQSPRMARGAAAFLLPRQALRFEEPELTSDELL
ncbi:MAG: helix-turn-helix domain-containing protein [Burkholderiales bacterium]